MEHMAAAGAFSSISSSGFYINPEDEASELEFLIQKNIVARLGKNNFHIDNMFVHLMILDSGL